MGGPPVPEVGKRLVRPGQSSPISTQQAARVSVLGTGTDGCAPGRSRVERTMAVAPLAAHQAVPTCSRKDRTPGVWSASDARRRQPFRGCVPFERQTSSGDGIIWLRTERAARGAWRLT
ncbi:MAG: hypothetical protein JWM85_2715 [Acidimicrobiaceae bacterium]|nr:hypothetical protein [Acidimicrobiaceae bacterium]